MPSYTQRVAAATWSVSGSQVLALLPSGEVFVCTAGNPSLAEIITGEHNLRLAEDQLPTPPPPPQPPAQPTPLRHDAYARECIAMGFDIPIDELHDDLCPACRVTIGTPR